MFFGSVSSLTPLSKCHSLVSLDLSKHCFDLTLDDLLPAISNLSSLLQLSLPRRTFQPGTNLQTGKSWPKSLVCLKINGAFPEHPADWEELSGSWPATLACLHLDYCGNAKAYLPPPRPFFQFCQPIQSLTVELSSAQPGSEIAGLVHGCRKLTSLSISASHLTSLLRALSNETQRNPLAALEVLELIRPSYDLYWARSIVDLFIYHLDLFPNLWKIIVDENFLDRMKQLHPSLLETLSSQLKSGLPRDLRMDPLSAGVTHFKSHQDRSCKLANISNPTLR